MSGEWDFITRGFGNSRLIYPTEMYLAHTVFHRTLPKPGRIAISEKLMDGDALTEKQIVDFYTIYLGPKGYENARSTEFMWPGKVPKVVDVFIHEMVHVWQFHHGINVWFEGIKVHINKKDNAYRYQIGKNWEDYDIEQQAQIVEDWFFYGMKETHDLYPYIRDCIRQGRTTGRYQK
jgi:hypothetical protein